MRQCVRRTENGVNFTLIPHYYNSLYLLQKYRVYWPLKIINGLVGNGDGNKTETDCVNYCIPTHFGIIIVYLVASTSDVFSNSILFYIKIVNINNDKMEKKVKLKRNSFQES